MFFFSNFTCNHNSYTTTTYRQLIFIELPIYCGKMWRSNIMSDDFLNKLKQTRDRIICRFVCLIFFHFKRISIHDLDCKIISKWKHPIDYHVFSFDFCFRSQMAKEWLQHDDYQIITNLKPQNWPMVGVSRYLDYDYLSTYVVVVKLCA